MGINAAGSRQLTVSSQFWLCRAGPCDGLQRM